MGSGDDRNIVSAVNCTEFTFIVINVINFILYMFYHCFKNASEQLKR